MKFTGSSVRQSRVTQLVVNQGPGQRRSARMRDSHSHRRFPMFTPVSEILHKPALRVSVAAGFFVLALALAVGSLLWNDYQATLDKSEADAKSYLNSAQAALERNLSGVEGLLVGAQDLLGLRALTPGSVDAVKTSSLMRLATQQNPLIWQTALVDGDGNVRASSVTPGSATLARLPRAFVAEALATQFPTVVFGTPVTSFVGPQRVLRFGRRVELASGGNMVIVAEVLITQLSAIMTQGANIGGMELTLERVDGRLLASAPESEPLLGQRLAPALGSLTDSLHVRRLPARLSGAAAIVVNQPAIFNEARIVASLPLDHALAGWREHRDYLLGVLLLFAVLIVGVAIIEVRYIRALARAQASIVQGKTTLDQALESMVSGFLLLDAEHRIVRWNRRFEEMFPWLTGVLVAGMPFRRMLEATARSHLTQASAAELENWVERRLAQQFDLDTPHEQELPNRRVIQITERPTPEGGLVIVYHDVTELRRASAEIEQLAFYDALTALPNRRLLLDRMMQAMTSAARSKRCGAVLFLDLDHFKTLNDTLGHGVGDLLLQQVAQRLKASVRSSDTVARLGGDEFVVMLEDLAEDGLIAAMQAQRVGEKIMATLTQMYQLGEHPYHITPSVGATLFGPGHQDPADLLKHADIAMYQVKAHGRNALCFFDPNMQAAITSQATLKEDLHAALQGAQFELYYQAQVQRDQRILGAEVLIRWQHPQRGLLAPAEFMAVAEDSGLILPIGHWVLRSACAQLALWQRDPRRNHLHLCVNISARQFRQRDFVTQVLTTLQETGVNATGLMFDLTEALMLDNVPDTIAKMTELKTCGVRFAVDDFGTGHASLAYLTRLPLDQLKIDQSFMGEIALQTTDARIVQTIIGMAGNLNLEVIAEGVETQAQCDFLAEHGCTLYQGYLFGHPVPLADFELLLSQSHKP